MFRCSLKLYSFQVLFLISECKITANPVSEQISAFFSSPFVATQALYCDNSRKPRRYLSQRGTREVREVTFGCEGYRGELLIGFVSRRHF